VYRPPCALWLLPLKGRKKDMKSAKWLMKLQIKSKLKKKMSIRAAINRGHAWGAPL
jgi:hypothetical protein